MSKEVQKVTSAFTPVEIPPQIELTPVSEPDIVDTLIIDTYETDDEGNVRPVTKQVVTGKHNRKAYIESFADEVGLENILAKIGQGAIAEDKYSILKSNPAGSVTDLRPIAGVQNLGDIEALAANAKASFARLDPSLKKGMSFAEFCSKFNNADLDAFVKAKVEANAKKEEGAE